MTKDFTTRSTEEARTLALFDVNNLDRLGIKWTTARQVTAMVWRACWVASLTAEQVNKRAQALGDLLDTPDLRPMLALMTRKKLLRTRRREGRTYYEVNY